MKRSEGKNDQSGGKHDRPHNDRDDYDTPLFFVRLWQLFPLSLLEASKSISALLLHWQCTHWLTVPDLKKSRSIV